MATRRNATATPAASRPANSKAKSTERAPRKKLNVLSSKLRYKGEVFSIYTDEVEEPNGVRAKRDTVRHSGSVVVLVVDDAPEHPEPRILLERQFRYPAGKELWEVPAGRMDPGEKALAGAKRELLEETGYKARHWRRILHFYASPGFLDETMDVFLATGLAAGTAQPEEDEKIAIRFFPLSTAVDMVVKGAVQDAKTIASILWYDRERRNGA